MSRSRRSNRTRKIQSDPVEVTIESLSHEGRGISHIDGKTVFVFAALVGERVKIQLQKNRKKFDQATTLEVLEASSQRIEPRCEAFQTCGGCSLQHMSNDDQVAFKQQSLLERLEHAGIEVGEVMPALRADAWGYRKKARLGVKYVEKKGRVLVGFREREAPYIADMHRCEVLLPEVGEKLDLIAEMIDQLEARSLIPQIEVAADDDQVQLVFRHLKPLSSSDQAQLVEFAKAQEFYIQLQSAGPDSVENLYPKEQQLSFKPLQNNDLKVDFKALDFVQVNSKINQQMVAQALQWLDLKDTDEVLDLFCGLGNFTLPLAQLSAEVTGVEVDQAMVERARHAALANDIHNTQYEVMDLNKVDFDFPWMRREYDKILLDPPRSGALEMCQILGRFRASTIVYVSCQASSLVRDAAIICAQGYRLEKVGAMDMFPQTAHVESMAVFKRIKK